jgi:ATP-dependent protease HslVU (ClpYQ) peptidase subunit
LAVEDTFSMAMRHVSQGADRIERQIQVIAKLTAMAASTNDAERLLSRMEATLELHRRHVSRLLREVEKKAG